MHRNSGDISIPDILCGTYNFCMTNTVHFPLPLSAVPRRFKNCVSRREKCLVIIAQTKGELDAFGHLPGGELGDRHWAFAASGLGERAGELRPAFQRVGDVAVDPKIAAKPKEPIAPRS